MKILIVGGGIAGSALAYALRRDGHRPVVVEARSRRGNTGGAFLYLAPNGINALRAIGLGDVPSAASGFAASGMQFFNRHGRRIAVLDGARDLDRYGARGVVLQRARLHEELVERARALGVTYRFGARLVDLRSEPAGIEAVLADGETVRADAVIGADGIRSAVRRLTWPDAPSPSYNGIVDCGGRTEVDLPDTPTQQMHFGYRAFFGYTVHDRMAYWFSNVPRRDEPGRDHLDGPSGDDWLATVRRLHEHDRVRNILRATPRSFGAWPLYDLPMLESWQTDRVCLIGDAAHAVSPSTGQGASLAIEDAAALANRIQCGSGLDEAFRDFTAERKPRADRIIRFGRRIGARKVSSPIASAFRDLTLPAFLRMGASATVEQYGYRVPGHGGSTRSPIEQGELNA